MRVSKSILLALLALSLTTVSFAKKYSDAPAGQGASTVGTSGDYASLLDASLDFNTTAATGNWTLTILNDLTETQPVYFGKTVNSSYVNTIKPAAATNPVVTFTASSATLAGGLVFGAQGNDINVLYPTNNFVVDGSNNGTNSRNLTFVADSSSNASWFYTVRVYGDCDNFTIKNCNIFDFATTANAGAALGFCSRVTTGDPTVAFHPDNALVQNCYILSSTGKITSGAAFEFAASGTLPTGSVATGFTITNCLVESYNNARSIYFVTAVGQGVVSNNTIHSVLPTGTTYGIYPLNFNGSNNLNSIVVSGNVIDKISNGRNSTNGDAFVAMNLCGKAAGNGTVGAFYVYNNTISGFELTGTPAAVALAFKGIRNYSSSEGFYVYNNTINIPAFDAGWTGLGASYGIGVESGNYAGPCDIKNNIVRINAGKNFTCLWKINSSATTVASFDNNVYAALSGSSVARVGGTYYASLADFKAAYPAFDANSGELDPMTSTPGHWISETNHHFSANSVTGMISGTPITSPIAVTTDIDGDVRSASAPTPGIDELISPASVSDWVYME
jgi:hypothetical protein